MAPTSDDQSRRSEVQVHSPDDQATSDSGIGRPQVNWILRGRVETNLGAAVNAATVAASHNLAKSMSVTNEAGEFKMEIPPGTGTVTIVAYRPGYQPRSEQIARETIAETGIANVPTFVLQSGVSVLGRILSGTLPASGAIVLAWSEKSKKVRSRTWCDCDGAFVLGASSDDPIIKIAANHGQYGHASMDIGRASMDTGVVRDQVVRVPDLMLSRTGSVSGQLVYSSGEGISGASVQVASTSGSILDSEIGAVTWHVTTDAGGNFSLYGMRAGSHKVLLTGAMIDELWRSPPLVYSDKGAQRLTIPATRVKLRVMRGGKAVDANDVDIQWAQDGQDPKKWNRFPIQDDRFLPHDSKWAITARMRREPGHATMQLQIGRDDVMDVTMHLQ